MRIIRDSSGFEGGTPEPILVTHQWKPPRALLRAIGALALEAYAPFAETVPGGRPGDVVRVTIERPGEPAPRVVPLVLGPRPEERGERTPARTIAMQAVGSFPVVFLAVG